MNALLFRSTRIARGEEIGWLLIGTRAQPYADTSLPMFERVGRDATTLQSVVGEALRVNDRARKLDDRRSPP